jgi:3-keto-5-aminohexanoate cleavage enzyme
MSLMALLMGGHIRVGMEDNIYYQHGVLARSNAQFVERIARFAQEYDREIATPGDARQILGIRPASGRQTVCSK